MRYSSALLSLLLASCSFAAPASPPRAAGDGDVLGIIAALLGFPTLTYQPTSPLSDSQIQQFVPFLYYTSAAQCPPQATRTWSCGKNCLANPSFKPIAAGGDGAFVQYWYVGYDPDLETIIVGHQGTDFLKIIPGLTDANIVQGPLNPKRFPGLPSSILVHQGFMNAHAAPANDVLAAVIAGGKQYNTTSVTIVGHSLGAAIGLLESVYLPLHLPQDWTFKSYLTGLPRVGNPAFANYVDSPASKVRLTRITNKQDPTPAVPSLGYMHPSGEVHIDKETNLWYRCPGQENGNQTCIDGDDPQLAGFANDHNGPYGPVTMGCKSA